VLDRCILIVACKVKFNHPSTTGEPCSLEDLHFKIWTESISSVGREATIGSESPSESRRWWGVPKRVTSTAQRFLPLSFVSRASMYVVG
jgi:hypothetical protein